MKSLLKDMRGWLCAFFRSLNSSVLSSLLPLGQQGWYKLAYCRLASLSASSYFSLKPCGEGEMIHSQLCFFPAVMFLFIHRLFNFMKPALYESWNVIASSWVKWTISVPIVFLKKRLQHSLCCLLSLPMNPSAYVKGLNILKCYMELQFFVIP